jgi:hypothetical protein
MEGGGFTAAGELGEALWVGSVAIGGEVFTKAASGGWAGGANDATGAVFLLNLVAWAVVLAVVGGDALVAICENFVGIILRNDGRAGDAEDAALRVLGGDAGGTTGERLSGDEIVTGVSGGSGEGISIRVGNDAVFFVVGVGFYLSDGTGGGRNDFVSRPELGRR